MNEKKTPGFFRRAFNVVREKIFGASKWCEDDVAQHVLEQWGLRKDQGPATRRYVRSMFPPSVWTKPLTEARIGMIRAAFARMRPEQRIIARRYGYDKGVV